MKKTFIISIIISVGSVLNCYGQTLNETDSLFQKIPSLYHDVLSSYFLDEIGQADIDKYGYLFVVSNPHAFPNSFLINGKQFRFINPPYHDLFVMNIITSKVRKNNKGRTAYFIYDNLENKNVIPDTLTITFSNYVFNGMEGRKKQSSNWEQHKKTIIEVQYIINRKTNEWIRLE